MSFVSFCVYKICFLDITLHLHITFLNNNNTLMTLNDIGLSIRVEISYWLK